MWGIVREVVPDVTLLKPSRRPLAQARGLGYLRAPSPQVRLAWYPPVSMAYSPRPLTAYTCPYCQRSFTARHNRRQYCGASCRVRASYARTGRRASPRAAELETLLSPPRPPEAVGVALPSLVVARPPSSPIAPPPAGAMPPRPAPIPPSAPAPPSTQEPGYWLWLACESVEHVLRRRKQEQAAQELRLASLLRKISSRG